MLCLEWAVRFDPAPRKRNRQFEFIPLRHRVWDRDSPERCAILNDQSQLDGLGGFTTRETAPVATENPSYQAAQSDDCLAACVPTSRSQTPSERLTQTAQFLIALPIASNAANCSSWSGTHQKSSYALAFAITVLYFGIT